MPLIALLFIVLISCGCCQSNPQSAGPTNAPSPAGRSLESGRASTNHVPMTLQVYSYELINTWPHDTNAFTQGLVFLDGTLLESTGLNGQSTLRKVELKTGKVLKKVEVPPQYFAEGLAVLNGKMFQLTWRNQKGFVYDLESLSLEKEFPYEGEGWGLTTDGQSLIMSDGSNQIRFLDPITFKVKRAINVTHQGQPVSRLNELEYIKGEIFANVWGSFLIVRISPQTGAVLGVINFTGLLSPSDYTSHLDVMNGIAYDPAGDRLFVTGKNWPKLFEVRLKP